MINDLMVDDKIEYFLVKFYFRNKEQSVSSLERRDKKNGNSVTG